MDIFKQAAEMDADYYDFHTGNTYLIQEYNRAKRLGLPTLGIRVVDPEGNIIGIVREESNKED